MIFLQKLFSASGVLFLGIQPTVLAAPLPNIPLGMVITLSQVIPSPRPHGPLNPDWQKCILTQESSIMQSTDLGGLDVIRTITSCSELEGVWEGNFYMSSGMVSGNYLIRAEAIALNGAVQFKFPRCLYAPWGGTLFISFCLVLWIWFILLIYGWQECCIIEK